MEVRLRLRFDRRGSSRLLLGSLGPDCKSPRQGQNTETCGSAQDPRRRDIPEIVLAMVKETRATISKARITTTTGTTFLRH
jgi:hypothetical protein